MSSVTEPTTAAATRREPILLGYDDLLIVSPAR